MSFENAMQILLTHEGGFSNDAHDHGGATNHGITQSELGRWRGHGVSVDDVRNLTVAEATAIYKANYWDVMNLDALHTEILQLVLFDQGVLNGPQTAVMALQQEILTTVDGVIGPETIAAIERFGNDSALAMRLLCDMQMRYVQIVKRNASQIVFLEGWLRRTQDLMLECV
jgi:lysozyme family protein